MKTSDEHPNNSQEVVYLSVALALQRARESRKITMQGMQFDKNPFVKMVLDPRMFRRFNDGILQAALLRALSKSELNYSCSEEMSREFRQITISVLENRDTDTGEAALEFLAAVSTKKVSLRDQDFEEIEEYCMGKPPPERLWKIFTAEPVF